MWLKLFLSFKQAQPSKTWRRTLDWRSLPMGRCQHKWPRPAKLSNWLEAVWILQVLTDHHTKLVKGQTKSILLFGELHSRHCRLPSSEVSRHKEWVYWLEDRLGHHVPKWFADWWVEQFSGAGCLFVPTVQRDSQQLLQIQSVTIWSRQLIAIKCLSSVLPELDMLSRINTVIPWIKGITSLISKIFTLYLLFIVLLGFL